MLSTTHGMAVHSPVPGVIPDTVTNGSAVADDPQPAQALAGDSSGQPTGGAVTLFEIPFASAMRDGDLALLARTLDLSMRFHPKTSPRHDSPGLGRLDRDSGLFLNRGVDEGQWTLTARTWGHPAAQSVHEWHVLAAGGAHQLDPSVTRPERLTVSRPELPDRPLGRAASKRFARIRRRMVGLS